MVSYRLVIQYCETALRAAGGTVSAALMSDLYSMQARAYARIGDRQSAHTHMTFAESTVGRIRNEEEPAETSYIQPGLAETQHVEVLRHLGDLSAAEHYAVAAVRTAKEAHLRSQVHRYASLATILIQRGRVDEALEPAHQMLNRIYGMESGRLHDRLNAVHAALLARSTTPDVCEFTNRAAAELALGL